MKCLCCSEDMIEAGSDAQYQQLSAEIKEVLPFLEHTLRVLVLKKFRFYTLSRGAQAAIVALSHVRKLVVSGVSFRSIEEMLSPFQNIFQLKVQGINIQHCTGPIVPFAPLSPLPFLSSYEAVAGDYTCLLLSPNRYIHARSITRLTFDANTCEYLDKMADFIKAVGATLEHLRLRFALGGAILHEAPISLSENINLVAFVVSSHDFSSNLWWLEHAMPTILCTTRIRFEAWVFTNNDEYLDWSEQLEAEELESLVSQYPHHDIELTIHIEPRGSPRDSDADPSLVREAVVGMLPGISQRGALRFLAK
ncbi:hypothetical protein DXG01_007711 [Tephrocybe rancida]|nr:hypothetical protein DXG01_007711 [Tephrocybe rancida]